MSNARYHGKPFVRLLECYVLWTIDELGENEASTLFKMTPKLQSIYKIEGNWQSIIANVMHFPPNMPSTIQELWNKNSELARKNGEVLAAQHFAEMFVDENLN